MRISDWSSDVCSSDLVGSNTGATNQITLTLDSGFDAATLSVDSAAIAITGNDSATAEASTAAALDPIDAALATINSSRADLGAAQNRLTSTIRTEEHTSEIQTPMRISYAVFCLKKKNKPQSQDTKPHIQTH